MRRPRSAGWRWTGRKGAAKRRRRPKPGQSRPRAGWLPALVVVGVAAVGAVSLASAYRRPSGPPPEGVTGGVVLRVAVFEDTTGLEEFLGEFLPWALDRGSNTGIWGAEGARVEVVEAEGPPTTWAVTWGPFPVSEAGRRLSEVEVKWGLRAEVAG